MIDPSKNAQENTRRALNKMLDKNDAEISRKWQQLYEEYNLER